MQKPPLSPRLQLALEVCHAAKPLLTGEITFRCIGDEFKAKGVTYHDLAARARRGYLQRSAKGRYTVYYRLVGPRQTTRRQLRR
jgi:hypothetical protein